MDIYVGYTEIIFGKNMWHVTSAVSIVISRRIVGYRSIRINQNPEPCDNFCYHTFGAEWIVTLKISGRVDYFARILDF